MKAINGRANSNGRGCCHAIIMSVVNMPKTIPARMHILQNHFLLDVTVDLVRIKTQDAIPKAHHAKKKTEKYDSTCSVFIEMVSQE